MHVQKKHTISVFLTLLGIFLLFPAALIATDFNPNFIISDQELQNYNTMNTSDIQAFLQGKGGYLSTLITQDCDGNTKSAAEIIYKAAQESQINPKYLLVKLQKEQSLVTAAEPTQKQLDWATGYGVCDSCSMSDPDIQKFKGFGTQVDRAAGIMRWYYNNVNSESWIMKANTTYQIDGTTVQPANLATAFLYTYTPHLHGNENFWKLWQNWFEQVYPNGSLLKSTHSSDVYILQDGKKRKFKTMTALVTRYNPKMIITIPPSELARYENGADISLPNYSVVRNGSQYYLIDYDFIRPFASADVVRALGYNPDEIVDITSNDIVGYLTGPTITADIKNPLGKLVEAKENKEIYYIINGTYSTLPDKALASAIFPYLTITKGSLKDLEGLNPGTDITLPKDGTLIGITGSNKIYVVEAGKKRHIASEEVFNGLGYNWKNIIWVNQFVGILLPDGEPLYVRIATNTSTPQTTTPTPTPTDSDNANNGGQTSEENPVELMVKTPEDKVSYIGTQFTTDMDAYIIADYTTGKILAGKNIDTVRPMASFVKVMTGYQLLVDGINLNNPTTYNSATQKAAYHNFRIAEGEKILNKDLMSAMLVSSINTPARMLVNRTINQEAAFIKRMNATAKSIGATKTVFTDSYGFDTKNVTTARDYLSIFLTAVKNADMRAYLGAKNYQYDEVLDKDGKPHHYDISSNVLANKSGLPYSIVASKTGFLYESGTGLAMMIERPGDKKQFIVITMGNPEFDETKRFDAPDQLARWTIENL